MIEWFDCIQRFLQKNKQDLFSVTALLLSLYPSILQAKLDHIRSGVHPYQKNYTCEVYGAAMEIPSG